MRRLTICGFFISTLIAVSIYTGIASATSIHLPSKSELESAATNIETFIVSAQSYVSTSQRPQEYEYLNSLAQTTRILIDNYDDPDFTTKNANTYNLIVESINEAIKGCRYLFGIVRAEAIAAQAASANQPNTTSPAATAAPAPQSPAMATAAITTNTDHVAAPDAPQASEITETPDSEIISDAHEDIDETNDTAATVEVPHTGSSKPSLSLLFIVAAGFIAAAATTVIYCIYNYQPSYSAKALRKKRH